LWIKSATLLCSSNISRAKSNNTCEEIQEKQVAGYMYVLELINIIYIINIIVIFKSGLQQIITHPLKKFPRKM
jgi:hypothetical protein